MITIVSHLKPEQIAAIAAFATWIGKQFPVEKIICFGTRTPVGNWGCFTPPGYDSPPTQPGYDFLLLTTNETRRDPAEMLDTIAQFLGHLSFTANVLIQKMETFNRSLEEGRPFGITLYHSGLLVFDRGEMPIAVANSMNTVLYSRNSVMEHWDWKNCQSWKFFNGARFYQQEAENDMVAYHLNQSTFFALSGILRLQMGYRTTHNDIRRLLSLTLHFTPSLVALFPAHTPEEKALLTLLVKAVVHVKYRSDFSISHAVTEELFQRVKTLREQVVVLAKDYIHNWQEQQHFTFPLKCFR